MTFPELEIVERRRAADGFVKYLFRVPDGGLIEAVSDAFRRRRFRRLVVDPVMVATSGAMLLRPAAVATLRRRGVTVMDVGEGDLACGYEARGRMAEPVQIVQAVTAILRGRR